MAVGIIGSGHALPSRVVSNDHFDTIGLTDEWIYRRTGIHQRRWLNEDDQLQELAQAAVNTALTSAATDPGAVDLLIVATTTAERRVPALAPLVAADVGMKDTAGYDLNAACSGFLYGITMGIALIESRRYNTIVVCGIDGLSRITNSQDRNTACLFGDAAGAVVLAEGETFRKPYSSLGSDGARSELISMDDTNSFLCLEGLDVYEYAVCKMSSELKQLLDREAALGNEITVLIPHQANGKMLKTIQSGLDSHTAGLFYSNIELVGNTSAASIPVALHCALTSHAVRPAGRLASVSFGAGMTWGAVSIDYDVAVSSC